MNNKPAIPMKNLVMFLIASVVIMFVWTWVENKYWPKPKQLTAQQQREVRSELAPLQELIPTGAGLGDLANFVALESARAIPPEKRTEALAAVEEAKRKAVENRPKPPPVPAFKPQLVELGNAEFNLQVRFTNKGGGVDRVIVTRFPQANKYGREVKEGNGQPRPLHLIPSASDRDPADFPDVDWASAPHEMTLPSFLLYHYATPDEQRPEPTLGEKAWKILPRKDEPKSDTQEVAFETELPEFGVKITKTFTLQRRDYHIGLVLRIEKLPGATIRPLRYQLSGGHGLPIEGIWYTGVFRNFIVGLTDAKGAARRHLDDSATIHSNLGSERIARGDGKIQYVAAAGQYFVSALCIDDSQDPAKQNFIEFARATAEENEHPKDKPQLGDISPRMISEPLTLGDVPVEHRFILYHGPVKVRLLHQFKDGSVADSTVERYEKALNLKTLTDYQSSTWLGSFANFIGWTDLTVAFTNLMHFVLGFLMRTLQVPVLAIIALTVMVRLLLLPLSRKQTATMQRTQEKMAALQPKMKELEERFRGRDAQELHQAKLKLMMENGINPAAQLGGCLLLLVQMPIFMGLYYALQENVFFRLEKFLWIENLAAPDMLFWWSEKIPFLSDPASLGSFYYLGPFFNILPIIAVSLMLVQQWLMAPPPADEQQAQQQKLMKYMMVAFALFFYKTPSGLVLYFIISSVWGLAERKLFPKKKSGSPGDAGGNSAKLKGKPEDSGGNGTRQPGWLQRKLQEVMEAAEKRDNTERRKPPARKRPR